MKLLTNLKKNRSYVVILLLTVLYALLLSANPVGDAYSNAFASKSGEDMFSPHHLLYAFYGNIILKLFGFLPFEPMTLLQLANAGDELQGIKRGIMEMADAISINKAELDPNRAELAATQYRSALSLFPQNENGWKPVVFTSSAYTGSGIDKMWDTIMEYVAQTKANGHFYKKRNEQNLRILSESINSTLTERFYNSEFVESRLEKLKQEVLDDKISAYIAAQKLIEGYFDNLTK